jgi:hypothetical protein
MPAGLHRSYPSLRTLAGSVAPFQVGHRGFQVGLPEPLLQRPRADALFLVTEGDECLAELVQFPRAFDVVLFHKVLEDAQKVALHPAVLGPGRSIRWPRP